MEKTLIRSTSFFFYSPKAVFARTSTGPPKHGFVGRILNIIGIFDTVLGAKVELLIPITRRQNFELVQIETNCRRHFKVHLKWKISTI